MIIKNSEKEGESKRDQRRGKEGDRREGEGILTSSI